MAVLILGQVALGKYAHELPLSPDKLNAMMWHKSMGVTLLLLAAMRMTWTWMHPRPTPEFVSASWQRMAARLNHVMLYVLMFAVPLSGWLMNSAKNMPFRIFRAIPLPSLIGPNESRGKLFQWWHEMLVIAILVLITIHVLAALWHHFSRRDDVLLRMLGIGAKP
jgi:cytochrome b561